MAHLAHFIDGAGSEWCIAATWDAKLWVWPLAAGKLRNVQHTACALLPNRPHAMDVKWPICAVALADASVATINLSRWGTTQTTPTVAELDSADNFLEQPVHLVPVKLISAITSLALTG